MPENESTATQESKSQSLNDIHGHEDLRNASSPERRLHGVKVSIPSPRSLIPTPFMSPLVALLTV